MVFSVGRKYNLFVKGGDRHRFLFKNGRIFPLLHNLLPIFQYFFWGQKFVREVISLPERSTVFLGVPKRSHRVPCVPWVLISTMNLVSRRIKSHALFFYCLLILISLSRYHQTESLYNVSPRTTVPTKTRPCVHNGRCLNAILSKTSPSPMATYFIFFFFKKLNSSHRRCGG